MSRRAPKPKPAVAPSSPAARRTIFFPALILLVVTFAVYAPVRQFDFVNFDDPDYITSNPHVRNGITPEGIAWALTSGEAANWFPVTRISHMLDCQWFGLDSGWHHLTNVLLHALAAILLFAFLHRATHALWRSGFVALLFALHPLHVESVAWVAERKDVLSAFFWFLALWAWVRYTERPAARRYALALGAFALGLMSKPMIVTLPFVLVLLDLWPLGRGWRLREKIPFFALSAAGAIATFAVQRASGAVQELAAIPIGLRVENAIVTCAIYIAKTIWPSGLAVFYPYPAEWPAWQVAGALVLVAGISIAAWSGLRTRPWFAAGWLWFLGTLLPVIGLVQVGAQARADRYMYVPMVGLGIVLAWGAAELLPRVPAFALAAVSCAAFGAVAWGQVQYWRNSETLFRHALAVTSRNYVAEHNLGVALIDSPDGLPEAIAHLQAALRIQPNSVRAHSDLGTAFAKAPGRLPEAIAEFQEAARLAPGDPIVRNNLAAALTKSPGRAAEGLAGLEAAVSAQPGNAEARNNLGRALEEMPGRLPEAIAQYEAALRLKPDFAEAHTNLGAALAGIPGRLPEAIAHYEAALRLRPDSADAHSNLAGALAGMPDRVPDAIAQYHTALRLNPNSAETHYNLGVTLSRADDATQEAIAQLEAAIRLKPDYAEAHNDLGVVLSRVPGKLADAIQHFEAALRIKPDYEDARYNLSVARGAGK